jgi:hypothetical protein
MRIIGVRMITFPVPYGSLEYAPLPPSGGRKGDRREYHKAQEERTRERRKQLRHERWIKTKLANKGASNG